MTLEAPAYVISASSHSAALFRQTLQGLIDGYGVTDSASLAITQNGTPNMSVNVAAGVIYCPGTLGATSGFYANSNAQTAYGLPSSMTSQGGYAAYNDATVNLTISAADPTNPRIDLVVASIQDAQYSGSNNQPVLQVITGTPAPSPSAPSAPASSVVLAQIAVAANATSIVTANITDERPTLGLNLRNVVRHVYTSSTTWTQKPGLRFAYVQVVGGGASGGGGSGSFNISVGSGGGAGEYRADFFAASALSATETITIGAGGAGVAGGFAGNGGGNSSFGSHITANGGNAGQVNNKNNGSTGCIQGGGGGQGGSGGSIVVQGGNGGISSAQANASGGNIAQAGYGGNTPLSTVSAIANPSGGDGFAGNAYGGGGSGAVGFTSNNHTSGAGASGAVIIDEYY